MYGFFDNQSSVRDERKKGNFDTRESTRGYIGKRQGIFSLHR